MVLDNKLYTYCTVKLTEAVKQAVDARESSWKWVHLSVPVVDGELGKLVLRRQGVPRNKMEKSIVR